MEWLSWNCNCKYTSIYKVHAWKIAEAMFLNVFRIAFSASLFCIALCTARCSEFCTSLCTTVILYILWPRGLVPIHRHFSQYKVSTCSENSCMEKNTQYFIPWSGTYFRNLGNIEHKQASFNKERQEMKEKIFWKDALKLSFPFVCHICCVDFFLLLRNCWSKPLIIG